MIFLFGDLGAGKTRLARALIRCLASDSSLPVPSPSYLLANVYPILRISPDLYLEHGEDIDEETITRLLDRDDLLDLHHIDLYRLEDQLKENSSSPSSSTGLTKVDHILDLKNVFKKHVAVVEWPQRLPVYQWPNSRLDIHIEFDPNSESSTIPDSISRKVKLIPRGDLWKARFEEF